MGNWTPGLKADFRGAGTPWLTHFPPGTGPYGYGDVFKASGTRHQDAGGERWFPSARIFKPTGVGPRAKIFRFKNAGSQTAKTEPRAPEP